MSTGKTSKYLKYAIGEIILVVIGILIALQINNWNESNRDSIIEHYLLTEMLKEFKNDSIELSNYIRLTNFKVGNGKMIKDYLNGNKRGLDTVLNHIFFNGKSLIFRSFTPTYDEIVSSGQGNIIKNDSLKYLIKEFKQTSVALEDFLFNDIQEIKKRYNFHLYKYFDHEIITHLWAWIRIKDSINPLEYTQQFKKDFEGFRSDPDSYYHVSNAIGADAELHRSYTQRLMPKITKVLSVLRKEQNND